MTFALACASHTPMLLDRSLASNEVCSAVERSFAALGAFVGQFAPDQIIQFSPDHFHGFHYDNMPSFCVGASARSYGDWNTQSGALPVDEGFALALLDAFRSADIDAALSYDMVVDHGFVQIWEAALGSFDTIPVAPVFVNCIAEPLPTYKRARQLGEAAGRFAAASGKRILFAASGGLSHDPIVPKIRGATPELRDRLIGKTRLGSEQQAKREADVRAAARQAMNNEGPSRALSPDWDREFLQLLSGGDLTAADRFCAQTIVADAGAGANECLCWVAAMAAMTAASRLVIVQNDYIPVPGWLAGMGFLTARAA